MLVVSLLPVASGVMRNISVKDRWEATYQLVNESSLLVFAPPNSTTPIDGRAFAAIATGPDGGGELTALLDVQNISHAYKFALTDTAPGNKTRVELTTCFATQATLHRDNITAVEAAKLETLHFVYQNCSGAPYLAPGRSGAVRQVRHKLRYAMKLPMDFPADGQAIMGQWHGRPDPRLFKAPNGSVIRFSTEHATTVCAGADPDNDAGRAAAAAASGTTAATAKMPNLSLTKHKPQCEDGVVYGAGGAPTGWTYEQGGYPPLTFGYSAAIPSRTSGSSGGSGGSGGSSGSGDGSDAGGFFYIYGRHDDRAFTPKGDCGFNPAESGEWPTRVCPGGANETVHGMWRSRFASSSALMLGRWVQLEWDVKWSAFGAAGGLLRDGEVTVRLDGKPIVDSWSGPLGRNDQGRSPYFKYAVDTHKF